MDAGVGLTTCVPIIPFLGAHDGKAVLCSMAVGLILLAFNLLYYKAIRIGDPSSVAGQLQRVPLSQQYSDIFASRKPFRFPCTLVLRP